MGTQFKFPKPGGQKMIDARAVRRDMSGNVISQPGESAFTGMHRDMSGNPTSGKLIGTGANVNFPRPGAGTGGAYTAAATPASESGAGRFPRPNASSRMTTGNADVHFQGADERLGDM